MGKRAVKEIPWLVRRSVRKTHASGGLIAKVDADAEEVRGAGGFASLAANTVLGTR